LARRTSLDNSALERSPWRSGVRAGVDTLGVAGPGPAQDISLLVDEIAAYMRIAAAA
jgi:hypothetical protein